MREKSEEAHQRSEDPNTDQKIRNLNLNLNKIQIQIHTAHIYTAQSHTHTKCFFQIHSYPNIGGKNDT